MSALERQPRFAPRPSLWRNIARRAFATPSTQAELRYRHAGAWSAESPRVIKPDAHGSLLAILVPSLAPQTGRGSITSFLAVLAVSVRELQADPAAPACFVAIAMQDRPGLRRREALLEELEAQWAQIGMADIPLVGVAISQPSKILALNACGTLLDTNCATCVAWFDDDVEIEPGCLRALWKAFAPHFDGIYGVRKIATGDRSRFSRLWARTKNQREPINTYPHGCGMLMSRAVFGAGIPLEYITDDHYYLFRFLEPNAADPFQRLQVIPEAIVRVPSVNGARTMLGRTARNYRNLQRVLADVPEHVRRYFLRELHFPGLRAPQPLSEALTIRYWRRLALGIGKRAYWTLAQLEILGRGLIGRPRRGVWFSAPPPHTLAEGGPGIHEER